MIEAQTSPVQTVNTTTMSTPSTITTTMILADLENGIDRPGIKAKYNLEGWELTEMFKHPVLKGKKASRKRKMSFNFVDDTAPSGEPAAKEEVRTIESSVDNSQGSDFDVDMTSAELAQDAEDRNEFEKSEQSFDEAGYEENEWEAGATEL